MAIQLQQEQQQPKKEHAEGAGKDDNDDIDIDDSSDNKESKASSAPSLASILYQNLRNMCLAVTCTVHAPMYSMLIANSIYGVALYKAHTLEEVASSTPWLRWTLWLYLVHCVTDRTPSRGWNIPRATREWLRRWPNLRWTAQYFPVSLHKTYELDDQKDGGPFIFLYHPHGVIAMGANTALNTNACDFDKLFPGVRNRWSATLNVAFYSPLYREWMLAMGFVSANKATLAQKLAQGDSIVLVPGGAVEALHAHEANLYLHLASRRGFIRLAQETGAALVPCLGFGENRIFDTLATSQAAVAAVNTDRKDKNILFFKTWLFAGQHALYKMFSFSTPILTWPFPRQRPIHVVVGAPVMLSPTDDVEACFYQYTTALCELYDAHKDKYGYTNVPLEIV
jgi:hypothetical protein